MDGDAFTHMVDDLDQNMQYFGTGEVDKELDLFGFCRMIEDDKLDEELERRMGESESDSPHTFGTSSSAESSPGLKLISDYDKMSDYTPEADFCCKFIQVNDTERQPLEVYPVTREQKQKTHDNSRKQYDSNMNWRRENEINNEKARNPVYTHGPHSVLVDQGFIKYELEVPNNPGFQQEGDDWQETIY